MAMLLQYSYLYKNLWDCPFRLYQDLRAAFDKLYVPDGVLEQLMSERVAAR
ncbi:hypothetical protein PROFUN_08221 [Planoprotostelium fungivorum]|uniref:Uncharacterized protein n=1 Tax=Planoprotostelium fungivorum TaxID=1890364 RepID=A0A2P6N692_9EUKA|nr:hypothetical protein PROFUN_08221 [Planoprotostelium fungivorum]